MDSKLTKKNTKTHFTKTETDCFRLSDQGIVTVGVEGVQQAVEEFFTENGLERIESSITGLGPGGKLHQVG